MLVYLYINGYIIKLQEGPIQDGANLKGENNTGQIQSMKTLLTIAILDFVNASSIHVAHTYLIDSVIQIM